MRTATADGVRRRAQIPISVEYKDPPISQMLESNFGKRMVRLEEGLNTPEAVAAAARATPLWKRLRLSRRNRRRALLGLTCVSLLILFAWRWVAWERELVARVAQKSAVCMSGTVFGKHVRVLGFSDPSLPVMYFPRWNVTEEAMRSGVARVRSVEQSDMCPNQSSKMRFERVNVTYTKLAGFRRISETVYGLPAACVQHFSDAWNRTC